MANIADIFEKLVRPDDGNFSAELAQYVLGITFAPEDVQRYQDLADRIQDGKLSDDEREELESFVEANTILMIMKSKARRSLMQNSPAA